MSSYEYIPSMLTINEMEYVRVTHFNLADAFCDMGDDQQAEFLNAVAEASAKWAGGRVFQWESMRKHMKPEAVRMIREWAEYFVPEFNK